MNPPEKPDSSVGPYREHRADGWPLCPRCEEDELYSLDVPPTIPTIVGCYRCGWRPGTDSPAAATAQRKDD